MLQHVVDELHTGCEPLFRLLDHMKDHLSDVGGSPSLKMGLNHK